MLSATPLGERLTGSSSWTVVVVLGSKWHTPYAPFLGSVHRTEGGMTGWKSQVSGHPLQVAICALPVRTL